MVGEHKKSCAQKGFLWVVVKNWLRADNTSTGEMLRFVRTITGMQEDNIII